MKWNIKFLYFTTLYIISKFIKSLPEIDNNKIIGNKEATYMGPINYSESQDLSKFYNSINSNFTDKLKKAEEQLFIRLKEDNMSVNHNYIHNDILSEGNRKISSSLNLMKDNKLIPIYRIISLNSLINIDGDKTYGEVNEKVKFELANGSFSSIIRKISLSGSSDSLIAFKLSSVDIKLKEARIINNCLDQSESTTYNEPYICVIAIFDEINAKEISKNIEIQYEYVAENILRVKNQNINSIIWYYDNFKRMQTVENINLVVKFTNSKLRVSEMINNHLIAYPDKIDKIVDKNFTSFTWSNTILKPNEFRKFTLDLPIFNEHCRKLVRFY